MNIGDQSFYDSGQLMKNLVFGNGGFEPLVYRSILNCSSVTANTCVDSNQWSSQPTAFWTGATYEVISGASLGATGTVVSSVKNPLSCTGCGQIVTFDKSLSIAAGDYITVRNTFPGNAQDGWWPTTAGGATITSDTTDLSPSTQGKQAIGLNASGTGQSVDLASFFDDGYAMSFIQLNGVFQVSFRAKGMGGSNQINVSVARFGPAQNLTYLSQTVTLTNGWKDYTIPFTAAENGTAVGTARLMFSVSGSSVLLDDVSLTQTNSSSSNPTVFRDDVVNALQALKPGVLRMMGTFAQLGAEIPDQLAVPSARYREGYLTGANDVNNIPYGIHEFLQLCAQVGADPWITIPTATTPQEMTDLIEYFSGNGSDAFSASRIARGQTAPWTTVFSKIHLEFGNETWNGVFTGETMNYHSYPLRANQVFGSARQTTGYDPAKFDLVLDGFFANPWYTQQIVNASTQHDSIDIAPYLLYSINNDTMPNIYQALFAEPEIFDSPGGNVVGNLQVAATAARPTKINAYEVNLGTLAGTVTQSQLNQLMPSVGAGIANADHMFQMMRAGVAYQNLFCLQGYQNPTVGGLTMKLWGSVVDMGTTNRRRPQFLAEQVANSAIFGNMLTTAQTGANPTWNQPLSSDNVQLNGAHQIQSFAFTNGTASSVVMFNLSLTTPLPVTFSGANAPNGNVQVQVLTSANITDSNESAENVKVATSSIASFNAGTPFVLPPFSMTVLNWSGGVMATPAAAAPYISQGSGVYAASITVSLSDATSGAKIYYTTDGSAPTTASKLYSGAITIASTTTLRAIAVATGYLNSAVAQASFTIAPVTPTVAATPVISPGTGTYSGSQTVTITDSTAGASIYYTTDGTAPTTASTVYKGSFLLALPATVRAFATASGDTNSAVATATYASSNINYANGFTASNLQLNLSASLVGTALQVTKGTSWNAGTGFYKLSVPVGKFTTDFTFKATNAVADGFSFVLQNDPKGVTALGQSGSGVGYLNILKSVALVFDFYGLGTGNSTVNLYTGGVVPLALPVNMTPSGISLRSGDLFKAHLVYDGTNLNLTITDTQTAAAFTTKFAVNIPFFVGSNTAYAGFSGGTGFYTATQQIQTWTYAAN